MSSFVEGVCTLKIDNVSELFTQHKANTKLANNKSYERVHYTTHGPFYVGEYKCELQVCPIYGQLHIYIRLLDKTMTFKKCGCILLVQNHKSDGGWMANSSIQPNGQETCLIGPPKIKLSDDPTIFPMYFDEQELKEFCKNDCLLTKIVLWVVLDDSKVLPPKLVPQPHPKTNQPNCSPPDFISKLLTGEFEDIHFNVKEQIFTAHRAILAARSSVFRTELLALQDDRCWKKLHISVQHIDALTFKHLLHFIYTDSLPSDFEATTRGYHLIFVAAHHFQIEGLKSICVEKLTKAVTDAIIMTLELNEGSQELSLMKIVPIDCPMKPEIITKPTSVRKALLGDRVYDTSDD